MALLGLLRPFHHQKKELAFFSPALPISCLSAALQSFAGVVTFNGLVGAGGVLVGYAHSIPFRVLCV
jgi:hypothetical protein